LPDLGVTLIRETWTASCEDITPRSWLLQTHSSIPFGSPLLRPKPRSRSLCRLLPAPAANGTFSTLFCVSFLGCLVPCHGGPIGCTHLLTSPTSSAIPPGRTGWLPASFHERDFSWVSFRGCRHFFMFRPPSLLASQIAPTAMAMPSGGRGFYVRAERASLPPHAPDMLAVRTGN
jgi:hypothetical protein